MILKEVMAVFPQNTIFFETPCRYSETWIYLVPNLSDNLWISDDFNKSLFSASTYLPSGLQIKTKYYSLLVRGAVISPLHSRYNPVHKFIVSRLNLVKTDYEYNTINRIVTGLEKLEVIIILSQGCEDWLSLLQEWDHLIQVPALTWPSHRPPWYRSHVTCHMSHVQLPTCVQTRSISKPPRWSPGTATWPSQHIALPWYGTTLMYCYVF